MTASSLPILSSKFTQDDRLVVEFDKFAAKSGRIDFYLNEEWYFKNGFDCSVSTCSACRMLRANSSDKHYFTLDHSSVPLGKFTVTCQKKSA